MTQSSARWPACKGIWDRIQQVGAQSSRALCMYNALLDGFVGFFRGGVFVPQQALTTGFQLFPGTSLATRYLCCHQQRAGTILHRKTLCCAALLHGVIVGPRTATSFRSAHNFVTCSTFSCCNSAPGFLWDNHHQPLLQLNVLVVRTRLGASAGGTVLEYEYCSGPRVWVHVLPCVLDN